MSSAHLLGERCGWPMYTALAIGPWRRHNNRHRLIPAHGFWCRCGLGRTPRAARPRGGRLSRKAAARSRPRESKAPRRTPWVAGPARSLPGGTPATIDYCLSRLPRVCGVARLPHGARKRTGHTQLSRDTSGLDHMTLALDTVVIKLCVVGTDALQGVTGQHLHAVGGEPVLDGHLAPTCTRSTRQSRPMASRE